ncbi:hypothetical protein CKAH01_06277 [Colletotrichum kahawae]|uniref:Uncharacterized protein n=1 Tax=Colletotrichum kahawae TaxID=34407 RepID=A0AAD9YC59_COLKA|nr:hypothetical protein CKAH01_06277 [Colletotrichum kahawae]
MAPSRILLYFLFSSFSSDTRVLWVCSDLSLFSSFLISCFLTFCPARNEAMVVYLRMR